MPKRYATFLTALVVLWSMTVPRRCLARDDAGRGARSKTSNVAAVPQASASSVYEGKTIQAIELPGVADNDREHLLGLLPLKEGGTLSRDGVRDSIRVLYSTGRFADIQAEVRPSGEGVVLTFATSANYFVGAVDVEGAPSRPNANQIVNASKFQLGELYTQERLDRALENVRQLMQENGYYKARVTAESASNPAIQQVDVLFHVDAGSPAHVGEIKVTGSSSLSASAVEQIAHMHPGDRVTAALISNSLQRLRKQFQKEQRALAQVSIAEQTYRPERNALDFTFQIEPGPTVFITAEGYHISRSVMKREVPVYEENAVDDDLLNEGKRNLLDYLQSRGRFDATVEIQKKSTANTLRVIYDINPGSVHKLALVDIQGNKNFLDTKTLRSYLQIQPASRFLNHGKYSEALLKSDVSTLERLYRSSGFRDVKIETSVDDNYEGSRNKLAVHIKIDEGQRTRIGEVHLVGNQQVKTADLPETSTQPGQPYSEEDLANDRERILSYYFNNGFPNASLEISTSPSDEPYRENVTFSIQEGERFTVDQVMVAGTEHTRDYVVQRELQVRPGDPLSQQDLLNTQTRLYDLGIFSQVDTAVQNPEGTDPKKNVLVQVREAKRYTFTYGGGLEFQTGQPAGSTAPQGQTGVSPRVEFDVTRLNFGGRNQTLNFQSHVGRLQQRGLISYTVPKLFDSDKFKLIYTIFYDNSLDVATFTSQRLEGRIDLREQFGSAGTEPGTRAGPSSITYRWVFRRVKATNFAENFSPGEIALLSLPARVGGPGFTFIRDKRDNPLESTKGNYFTLDAFASSAHFGSEADFGRALAQNSTYQAFGGKGKTGHQYVFARSTTIGLQQPFNGTRVRPPGACVTNPQTNESFCQGFPLIPLPEQFFAGGGNSHRGFGLNQAGPRDPTSGFPVGGTALFVNNMELRFPTTSLPLLGEGFGFAIFHDMGNVFTAPHDMLKGLMRWHQQDPRQCLSGSTSNSQCMTNFNNNGYDYTSHALGIGVRYKTPIGPLRFDFGYNLNPTRFFQTVTIVGKTQSTTQTVTQQLRHFNVFFSIGQPF
ncbi:MAG TPA: POTRA domain-containing protein [Candidatus Sulfotelmatobacter sp.]|nr:POTRA domain-containing protein [Candidatus Sulfotelmatobacter sp.]